MSAMKLIYRIHGELASRMVISGQKRPGSPLRFVRLLVDLDEMYQMYGLRGVAMVVQDRLSGGGGSK